MSELLTLLNRAQNGDNDACQQVLTENVGLIWSIVKRYSGCGVDTDDLYQLGCIGFIKAVKGFDLTYGTQFSTYAVPKIAGEIRRFLRDDGSVKVGRSLREKGQTLFYTRERLRHTLGREPQLSELAQETGMTVEEVAAVELANGPLESLQQETIDGLTLESTLGTDSPAGAGKNHHTAAFFPGNDTGANCPYPEGISGTGVPLGAQGTGKAPGNFRSVTGFRSIWEVFNDIAAGVSKISRKLQVSNP